MLDALINLTSTGEFEDDGSLRISLAEFVDRDLRLQLDVCLADGSHEAHTILCRRPRAHRIWATEYSDSITILQDHPLIWPYSQPVVSLYFNGRAQDSRTLIGALLLAHHRLVGEWIPFSHFMNSGLLPPRYDLLSFGHGLLAEGPESVIAAYRSVLIEFGIRHSSPPAREPKWWDGASWQGEDDPLSLLLIGNSYVVAPEFSHATP